MSRIVCGIFETKAVADRANAELRREGLETDSFAITPAGQHSLTPIGGDTHSDAGARFAGAGAVKGALIGLVAGIALGLVASNSLGSATIALTALLGALVGAFGGALMSLRGARRGEATRKHPDEPLAGVMVAVNVERAGAEERVIPILKRNGARDVARAQGNWRNGSWQDFDPRVPLATI